MRRAAATIAQGDQKHGRLRIGGPELKKIRKLLTESLSPFDATGGAERAQIALIYRNQTLVSASLWTWNAGFFNG
jgi:hypothetical protein